MSFEIFQSPKTSKYYFRLKAKNHQIIFQSEAYEQKRSVKIGINSVSKNAKAGNFEKRKAKDGRDYFVLIAKNKEIIGKSQMYKSTSGLNKGIKSVINNANEKNVVDLTI